MKTASRILFLLLALAVLHPAVSSAWALILGMILSLSLGNPFLKETKTWTPRLLQVSVMGMGGAMNLEVVGRVGMQGFGYTIVGILLTLFFGALLGKALRVDRETSLLVSAGTAICGGSAIAAVASVTQAKAAEVSVALATVFVLNAASLFIFPGMGHYFGLDEHQFGLWSALAIHDMSSVAGAALQYGSQALEVATTVKLSRALWIIPLAAGIGMIRARESRASLGKIKKPWFIVGFVAVAAVVTWLPEARPIGIEIAHLARRCLVLTLFLIGSGLTRETLKSVGFRPFVQGLLLWAAVGAGSLVAIRELPSLF